MSDLLISEDAHWFFFISVSRRTSTTGTGTRSPGKLFYHYFLPSVRPSFYILACLTPVEVISSPDRYVASMNVDGNDFNESPYPSSFQMRRSPMILLVNFANMVCWMCSFLTQILQSIFLHRQPSPPSPFAVQDNQIFELSPSKPITICTPTMDLVLPR